MMNISVGLDSKLVQVARVHSAAESRSVPKQIEYWARIGRIAEENPDLPYNAIKGILLGLEDAKLGNVKEYDPDSL
jgi:hypothetical protein